jgi:CheY-like chemotaxis protein
MPVPRPLYPRDNTVLIVEDSRDDAVIMARALQTFGVKKWSTVQTAEDALAFLKRHPCDVALVDYRLPGMNGLQLLERIRESWPDILPIVVTGERDERVAVAAMKLGAADYIVKDDILMGGIIRSLQIALRERMASREDGLRKALSSGGDRTQAACSEAEWLLESFSSPSEPYGHRPSGPVAEYGAEGWDDALDSFSRYLRGCLVHIPDLLTEEEEGLVRMFVKRGSSPREVMMVYGAVLRSLLCEPTGAGKESPLNPTVLLARILARLVDEYQRQLSVMAEGEKAA